MTAPVEPISDAELKVVGFLDHVAMEALVKGGDPPEGKPIIAMMVARIEADAAALADRDVRIAALEAQVAVLGSDGNAARKRVRELNEEVAGLKTQVARLREALEFYGREWESDFVVTYATEDLLEDGGAKARAALSATAAPEPETPPAIIDENATADDALRAVYDAYKDNQARATAPAWVPTHRHYKGGLYRELMRVEREGDAEKMVVYEAEDGRRWVRPAAEFDSTVTVPLPRDLADGKREYVRRYAPLRPPCPRRLHGRRARWVSG